MDYRDKLLPSPWDTFAPPRRYIFMPPLTHQVLFVVVEDLFLTAVTTDGEV